MNDVLQHGYGNPSIYSRHEDTSMYTCAFFRIYVYLTHKYVHWIVIHMKEAKKVI